MSCWVGTCRNVVVASPGNVEAKPGTDPVDLTVKVWRVFSCVAVFCFRIEQSSFVTFSNGALQIFDARVSESQSLTIFAVSRILVLQACTVSVVRLKEEAVRNARRSRDTAGRVAPS